MTIKKSKSAALFLAILIFFGFFYAARERLSGNYMKSSDILYGKKETDAALFNFLFAGALGERDKNIQAKLKRADIFCEGYDLVAAENELMEILKIDGKNQRAYALLGKVKQRQEEFSEAENFFKKAYELDPSSENLGNKIGNMVREGKLNSAKEELKMVKKNLNEDAVYYLGLVEFNESGKFPDEFLQIRSGKYENEIRMIGDFCKESVSDAQVNSDYELVRRADLFNKINETDFAFMDLYAVLGRNKKYCDAYNTLGKSLLIEGDYKKSADAFQKCLELDVNNGESCFWLAGVYERLGDDNKAKEYNDKYKYLIK